MITKPDLDKSKIIQIIMILCLITSVGRFVLDSYLPSLPAIAEALGVSGNHIQLTLTLYVFGFGISQLVYGPLSDRLGRKWVLVGGLVIFILGNTLCAMTSSVYVLFISRLIAGIGAGACGVLNRAIASDCFRGTAFIRAWSYTTTTLVFSLIIAPMIGSIAQQLFNWRANFVISSAYVLVVLTIILWKLPETNDLKLDTLNIKKITKNYLSILSSKHFVACTFCYTFAFAGLISYFQVSPLILIKHLGLTPVEYGSSYIVIAACYFLGGIVVNQLARILTIKDMLITGILLLIISGLMMLSWNILRPADLFSILIPTAIYVIGARIVIPNSIASAFEGFRQLGGTTSGLIGSIQMLGSALVSYIITHFSYNSPLPLATLFIVLGFGSMISFFMIEFNEYKKK